MLKFEIRGFGDSPTDCKLIIGSQKVNRYDDLVRLAMKVQYQTPAGIDTKSFSPRGFEIKDRNGALLLKSETLESLDDFLDLISDGRDPWGYKDD